MSCEKYNLKRVTVVTGHYGCGKTNFAVNLAVYLKQLGENVVIADIDTVNPYFRTADFVKMLKQKDIDVITPPFANSNMDLPIVTAEVEGAIKRKDCHVIIDVGGDDAGATALGRFSHSFKTIEGEYDICYVVNQYRPEIDTPDKAVCLMKEIERALRLNCTKIVNNSNLSYETKQEDIEKSLSYAKEISKKTGLELALTTVKKDLADMFKGAEFFPVEIYVKPIWGYDS